MDKKDIMEIYDRLCMALAGYEDDDGSGDAGDAGERLYQTIVYIVEDFASKLN